MVVLGFGGYITYNYYKDYHKVQITVDNRLLKINLR